MRPYKILYIHSSNELYGADRSLLRLVKNIDKTKFHPIVFVPNDIAYEGLLTREFDKLEIEYYKINLGVLRRRYLNFKGMFQLLNRTVKSTITLVQFAKKRGISLIHSNSITVFSGGLASVLLQKPHIWHVREIITKPPWMNRCFALLLNWFSNLIIAVSNPVKSHLIEGNPKLLAKVKVIHNGLDPIPFEEADSSSNKIRNRWGLDTSDIIVGMVGRMSAFKGQEFLIQSAKLIIDSHQNAHFVLVGGCIPGEEELEKRLKDLTSDLNIEKNIHFESFREDIPEVVSAFDIFVLPSTLPDPFPTTVLEAMFSGKPVVVTNHGGAVDQVQNYVNGFLVSPNNPLEMASAINFLINNKELREEMGKAGKRIAIEKFSLEKHIKSIEETYLNILENHTTS